MLKQSLKKTTNSITIEPLKLFNIGNNLNKLIIIAINIFSTIKYESDPKRMPTIEFIILINYHLLIKSSFLKELTLALLCPMTDLTKLKQFLFIIP